MSRLAMESLPVKFQSSSGQKAGCNRAASARAAAALGFNPHPARRPDATSPGSVFAPPGTWFQSSSGQKAGCNMPTVDVSRLLSNRFQSSSGQKAGCNPGLAAESPGGILFQSSSGQKAGCNGGPGVAWQGCHGFQSSSGQKAGCNRLVESGGRRLGLPVSILIRPEGRMQPPGGVRRAEARSPCFNPHPARRPDATRWRWPNDP